MLLVQKDPQYGSLVRPTVEAGEDPGHLIQCQIQILWQSIRVRRRRRAQKNIPDWARPDSLDGAYGEDVGQSSRQRIRRPPSPPPPAARPAVERRQLRRRPAEAPPRPPPVAAVEEEEDEPKRKVRKDALPEGDYLVKWTAVEDKVRYIRWGPSALRISARR
ncbi:hypothetical protein R1sor_004266 [Riccia sorocarpa]|uniref:Chromo domain-containing protein n=1 Tax=Riccia sorocarpa TaxID=122646 RepID=A0ABD3H7Y0_9MARC